MLFTIILIVCFKKANTVKKHFNKELVMTKKDNVDGDYVVGDVKVRDHCHIIGNYRGSAHRDCNIKLKLNHKISVVFHNAKHDFHLIMQELCKCNFKINVIISKRLGKYMKLNINNNLAFIDSYQFLRCSLNSQVKSLDKDNFK